MKKEKKVKTEKSRKQGKKMWIFRKKEERGRAKNKKRGKKVKYRTNSKKIVGKNDFGLRKI